MKSAAIEPLPPRTEEEGQVAELQCGLRNAPTMIRRQQRRCRPLPDFRQIGTALQLSWQHSFRGPLLFFWLVLEAGEDFQYLPSARQGLHPKTMASALRGLLETSGS